MMTNRAAFYHYPFNNCSNAAWAIVDAIEPTIGPPNPFIIGSGIGGKKNRRWNWTFALHCPRLGSNLKKNLLVKQMESVAYLFGFLGSELRHQIGQHQDFLSLFRRWPWRPPHA